MKVAVLGCGYWGKNLARNFQALGGLAAVADPSAAGRAEAARIAPGVPVFADPSPLWEDASIDGIVIATPAETHTPLCEAALKANKDVLCEKPLALRYEDARRVVALAAEKKRILLVGHVLEYHPAILKLRSLIDEGQLGKIQYVYSNRLNLGKIRREENILWSFAPHDIAVILRLVGGLPIQVIAAGGAYLQTNVADVTITRFLFDNGLSAHIFVSWLNPFKEQRLVVVGTKQMATFDDVNRELLLHDQHVDLREGDPVPVKGASTKIDYAKDEPLRLECQAFLDAMKTRKPPLTDGESGLRVVRVLEAAQRSLIMQGQPVILPLGY